MDGVDALFDLRIEPIGRVEDELELVEIGRADNTGGDEGPRGDEGQSEMDRMEA